MKKYRGDFGHEQTKEAHDQSLLGTFKRLVGFGFDCGLLGGGNNVLKFFNNNLNCKFKFKFK